MKILIYLEKYNKTKTITTTDEKIYLHKWSKISSYRFKW